MFKHGFRILIDSVGGECRYELFVVPKPSCTYFFYLVRKNIVHSYQICVCIASLVPAFLNFHGKTKMYAVWVYTVIVCQHYLKVQLLHAFVRDVLGFFFCFYVFSHPLVMRSCVLHIYFAMSALYVHVDINSLFLTFSLASSQSEAVLSMAEEPPVLSNEDTVALIWTLFLISLCIFDVQVIKYFYFPFVCSFLLLLLLLSLLLYLFCIISFSFFNLRLTVSDLFVHYFFIFSSPKVFLLLFLLLLLSDASYVLSQLFVLFC